MGPKCPKLLSSNIAARYARSTPIIRTKANSVTSSAQDADKTSEIRVADLVSVVFVLVILLYAASGPISEFVRWLIAGTTESIEELSRRDQRLLFREHWLGAGYRAFERGFLLPTGMILGLPLALAFTISILTLPGAKTCHG